MRETSEPSGMGGMAGSGFWGFMRRHWGAFLAFLVAAGLAVAASVYVFWWFAGYAVSSGLVPSTLGLWTMANLVAFILNLIFWELLLIGIPAAIGAIVAWIWWKRIPADERMGYHMGRRGRSAQGGGAFSFLLFIAFCIKVWLDGNWSVPIASFSLAYVVGSVITILVWAAVIIGIPVAIALTWWVRHEMKKA
jgi:hypothetical protein